MSISSYKELIIWQKSMDLVEEIYKLTTYLPKEETYGMVSQMRRSAASIPSNIAEGHGRSYTKEYIHFLSVSQGSRCELETQLFICIRLGLLAEEQTQKSFSLCNEIGKMTNAIIIKLQNK